MKFPSFNKWLETSDPAQYYVIQDKIKSHIAKSFEGLLIDNSPVTTQLDRSGKLLIAHKGFKFVVVLSPRA